MWKNGLLAVTFKEGWVSDDDLFREGFENRGCQRVWLIRSQFFIEDIGDEHMAGVWVMQTPGFAFTTTAWGVTPQAQKTGISPFLIVTGSPKSGLLRFLIPIFEGSPIWIGAPCTEAYRAVIWTARATLSGGTGLMVTTRVHGRPGGFAGNIGNKHRNIFIFFDVANRNLDFNNASSKEKLQPKRKVTKSFFHRLRISLLSFLIFRFGRYCNAVYQSGYLHP